jgi:PAS domain S-box-containing protein/putative nucleotidyltransferase with HDIG domain
MKIHHAMSRGWGRLGITKKISLMFGALLFLILLVSVGSYVTLDNARKKAEAAILNGMQIQRLVLRMDSGLERARRLQRDFFLQYPQVGFSKARDTYAAQAVIEIADVISLSSELRNLIKQSTVSESLEVSKMDINLYLSSSQRYADTFLEAVELVTRLAGEQDGLETRIQVSAETLHADLSATSNPEWHDLYQDIRLFEKDYLLTRQRSSMQSAFNSLTELQRGVTAASGLSEPQKADLLADIQNYKSAAEQILQLDADIRGKLNDFNLQAEAIDPVSKKLIELSNAEVERAHQQVERANQLAGTFLALMSLAIVGLALLAADVLHRSITNNIIKLTQTAGELQGGNLDVTASIESEDELGNLARAFNNMTSRLKASFLSLQASEARFRLLAENSSDMISRHDAQGVYLYASPACRALLGYEPEELIGHTAFEFIHPDDLARIEKSRQMVVEEPVVDVITFRARRKDGNYVWLESNSHSIQDKENGETVEIHVSSRDVTERKEAEEKLRQSEAKYRSIFENAIEGIFQSTPQGRFLRANSAMVKMFGYATAEDLIADITDIGQQIYARPEDREKIVELLEKDGIIHDYEIECRRKDGSPFWVSDNMYAVRDPNGAVLYFEGALLDITERKRAEEALRKSEEKFAKAFQASPLIVVISRVRDAYLIEVNESLEKVMGYTREEAIGRTSLELGLWVNPAERERIVQILLANGRLRNEETLFRTKSGEVITCLYSAELIELDGEKCVLTSIENITERRRAEEALQKSEEKFRRLFETSRDFLYITALDGMIIEVNKAASTISGYSVEELKKMNIQSIYLDPANRALVVKEISARGFAENLEVKGKRKDGSIADVLVNSTIIKDNNGNIAGFQGSIKDISERKRVEEKLRESEARLKEAQRMALIGNWDLDLTTNKLSWSDEVYNIFGIEPAAFDGSYEAFLNAIHPDDREIVKQAYDYSIKEQVPYEVVYRLFTPSGYIKYAQERCKTFYDDEGRPLRSVGTVQDITKSRRAEEHIRSQLARLNALHNIDNAIKSSVDLQVTMNVFLDEVVAQLEVDAACVLLFNSHTLMLDHVVSRGFHSVAFQHTRLAVGDGYAGHIMFDRETVYVPDLTKVENQLTQALSLAGENFTTYIGSPLIAKDQVVGVLEIFQRSPLSPDSEWLDFLEILAGQGAIAVNNAQLFENLQRSNSDLTLAYDATIEGWSRAMDLRDKETEGHTQRVTSLTVELARQMGIPNAEILQIRRGALLHDIGKMGVPDNILLKPDKLTQQEWDIMRQHVNHAHNMLYPIKYLRPALDIPQYHHEKWDGTGYPHQLKGEAIPLAARIFTVVDVWDAVTSDRPYRAAWSKEKAVEYIKSESGKHFDPAVVENFLMLISKE